MGEIVEFPKRREGCSHWRRGQASISLVARPACAALAMALATSAPALKAEVRETLSAKPAGAVPARITPFR